MFSDYTSVWLDGIIIQPNRTLYKACHYAATSVKSRSIDQTESASFDSIAAGWPGLEGTPETPVAFVVAWSHAFIPSHQSHGIGAGLRSFKRSWGHPFSWISQNEVTGHVYMFRVFVSKAAAERPAVVFFEDNHLGPSIF
jgi:hypothetical protein